MNLIALVLAVCFTAFSMKKNLGGTFYYRGTDLKAAVENETNWSQVYIGCELGGLKACSFQIPESYITGSGYTLATLAPNVYVLASTATNAAVIDVLHASEGSIILDISNKD